LAERADHLIARPCYAHDDATPNANATLMVSLVKLGLATSEPAVLGFRFCRKLGR